MVVAVLLIDVAQDALTQRSSRNRRGWRALSRL
jgi:hypothetical protein